ncbi:isocitrate dehydrogenase [NAD] regulatory subunit 1, mitochondrial isoform X2 [Macadamia integrifolia]|uniref:isocitrate dehydrogenase [NAD] regulatory subunit 1, mitochondrial isoform X2 n=1 Tax=Macadamia integrifolia TaxID=60698 RepID=UPI001C4EADBB|nr:isocitrate dehydrogenase [NAD] regulatory subunit 1, mitochondrial isoform X2 [Macadamia integrifolia]
MVYGTDFSEFPVCAYSPSHSPLVSYPTKEGAHDRRRQQSAFKIGYSGFCTSSLDSRVLHQSFQVNRFLNLQLFFLKKFWKDRKIDKISIMARSIRILKQLLGSSRVLGLNIQMNRSVTYMPRPGDGAPRAVTLIPGDGIGPLVTGAVEQVMEAMHAPVYFERYEIHGDMTKVPQDLIASIKKNKVCLKGGLATPVGGGVSSLNVQLRKELDLYASLVNCFNLPGLPTRHQNVDIVVIRENTEGEYSGLEHEVVPGVVESLKVITKFCSERVAKYAFEYAYLNNRKTVTAVHKANIMKLADGLFLESCREVATKYPGIKYNEIIVDNCCMQLVSKPEQFDVMVTPNLYGNLVANTAAGIAGGTGVMPGGNVGADHAVFEQGASAGNVGNDKLLEQQKANPVALLLSSAMMLRHLQFPSFADRLETAVKRVISEGKHRAKDLGGDSTTKEVVDAVIAVMD